ncbi:MAG TPA: DUF488 domain-containing protein [Anaeromyxobacteraceae bacterium]|nr:DUF488 domain-containing protein [Anaeromyxobacteraceae bacterium]
MVRTKRAYEPTSRSDGYRILVDRLWPRGVSKDAARIDLWAKDVAPSPGLREWFGHRPERFREFTERYRRELAKSPAREALAEITLRAAHGVVTLVYGARDEQHNNAVFLKQEIDDVLGYGDARG